MRCSSRSAIFLTMKVTRALNTTSLKCCLPSTDAIERWEQNSRMRIKVQGRLMQVLFIEIHQGFAKKKRSDTFFNRVIHKVFLGKPILFKILNSIKQRCIIGLDIEINNRYPCKHILSPSSCCSFVEH